MSARTRVGQAIDRISARWRGAPPIEVVPSVDALPFEAPADAEGAYHRGRVLLVEDALSPERAAKVLAHEAIGHHGLRGALGGSWRSFMTDVLTGARRDPGIRAARERVERVYVGESGRCDLPALAVADEVSASLAEHVMDPVTGRLVVERPLQKQAVALAGHVAREVLLLDRPVTRPQLEGTILAAERYLRFGGRFFGLPARLMHWYAGTVPPPKPTPLDPHRPPMSWEASKELLAAEDRRAQRREDNHAMRQLSVVGALLVIFVGSLVYTAWHYLLRPLF